jgi:GrpB-like predicted nucleotidyltransferase (UPF0157 family)/GNAT superfamily N-acetyltransferase
MNCDVEVVAYNSSWLQMFEAESKLIKQALGSNCSVVHHIGSTSVPGLSAKPIIDILPCVNSVLDVDKSVKSMEALGYESKGEFGISFRRFFQKKNYNVHVFEENNPEVSRHIKFRDWMREHDDDANAYAALKLDLAKKFSKDIESYCLGKDSFVANIDVLTGYDGWRMVKALTHREWNAVRALRQETFFAEKKDPGIWSFEHKDHVHLVFYKNSDIIGYVHFYFEPEGKVDLLMIVIDKNYRKLGFGSQFLKLCELWLSHQGIKESYVKLSLFDSHECYVNAPPLTALQYSGGF